MQTVISTAPQLGVLATCAAFGVALATYYRHRAPRLGPRAARPSPARRLPADERRRVLDVLHEPRFVDLAPAQVFATLLEEGRYFCSVRTMHRILGENRELRERRDQLRHAAYAKPELLATGPNQLWSWDITKLLGPAKWTYYYLYVILDVFSRARLNKRRINFQAACCAPRGHRAPPPRKPRGGTRGTFGGGSSSPRSGRPLCGRQWRGSEGVRDPKKRVGRAALGPQSPRLPDPVLPSWASPSRWS